MDTRIITKKLTLQVANSPGWYHGQFTENCVEILFFADDWCKGLKLIKNFPMLTSMLNTQLGELLSTSYRGIGAS